MCIAKLWCLYSEVGIYMWVRCDEIHVLVGTPIVYQVYL